MSRAVRIYVFLGLALLASCGNKGEDGDFPENDSIQISSVLNPCGIAPLSAELNVACAKPLKIRVIVKGRHNDDLSLPISDASSEHLIPVTGLYPDFSNTLVVKAYNESGKQVGQKSVTLETGPADVEIPEIQILTNKSSLTGNPLVFVDFESNFEVPFIFDSHGELRWYLKIDEITREPFVSRGHPFIMSGSKIRPYAYRYDWVGKTDSFALPENYAFLHHDFCFGKNSFIAPATGSDGDEYVTEMSYSGELLNEWNISNIVKSYLPEDQDIVVSGQDWAHINFVETDSTDNSLLISFRVNLGLVKMDREGNIKWILADPHKAWNSYPGLSSLGLSPAEGCELPLGQHCTVLLENGDILMFDNGFDQFWSN